VYPKNRVFFKKTGFLPFFLSYIKWLQNGYKTVTRIPYRLYGIVFLYRVDRKKIFHIGYIEKKFLKKFILYRGYRKN
jgi:hypothetical protein